MGALLHVNVYYTELGDILDTLTQDPSYPVFGTFMTGTSVYDLKPSKPGIIIFGNEARGISQGLQGFIRYGITIPATAANRHHIESLNVASAVAIICAFLVRE
jgi:TrmH family RNA methyltransferase